MVQRYTVKDLKIIDPYQAIRRQQGMYFWAGQFSVDETVGQVVQSAFLLGAHPIVVDRVGPWTFIASDIDWLQEETRDVKELFDRIVSYPEAGINSMRPEILVATFFKTVFVALDGEVKMIKGRRPKTLLSQHPNILSLGRRVLGCAT